MPELQTVALHALGLWKGDAIMNTEASRPTMSFKCCYSLCCSLANPLSYQAAIPNLNALVKPCTG